MKKKLKCSFGYLHYRKIQTLIAVVAGFSLVLLLLFTGLYISGERKNYFTVAAILAFLPTAKMIVQYLMYPWKSCAVKEEYDELLSIAGDIPVFSDILITPEKKSIEITYAFFTKGHIICLCKDKRFDKSYHTKFIKDFLKKSDITCDVVFYDDYNKYKNRLISIKKNEPESYSEEELNQIAELAHTFSILSI